jgi:hypothetical protein
MSLQILKINKSDLISTGLSTKYNQLVDKVIHDITVTDNIVKFITTDKVYEVTLPSSALAQSAIINEKNGDYITYKDGKWVNVQRNEALGNHTDVALNAPVDGHVIVFENGKWVNRPNSASLTIKDLLDTNIGEAIKEGDVLMYKGGKWVNSALSTLTYAENNEYTSKNFITGGNYTKSISELDEILSLISPEPPQTLNEKTLALTNTTKYPAKLSGGLPAAWYKHSALNAAGIQIPGYVTDNTYTITTPSSTNTFRVGKKDAPVGSVLHMVNNTQNIAKVVTVGTGTGSVDNTLNNSTLSVTTSVYNSIWQKASAFVSITQKAEGHMSHSIKHVNADGSLFGGQSADVDLWYDASNQTPAFTGNVNQSEKTANYKYLSGIKHYAINSEFLVSFVAASGIFDKCYHPDHVSKISADAINPVNVNPTAPPLYTDSFTVVDKAVKLDIPNISSGANNGEISVTLYKPSGLTTVKKATLPFRVCTYDSVSTTTKEFFFDETQRINLNTMQTFVSNTPLANGNAQVRNGSLVYGHNDYGTKTGDQEYQRHFFKASANNGTVKLTGITPAMVKPYGTGDLNILLLLDGSNKYFDLGLNFGAKNGTGSGTSRDNSLGAKNDLTTTADTIGFSFGTNSTAHTGNLNQYRMIIIFRNTAGAKTLAVTSITTA